MGRPVSVIEESREKLLSFLKEVLGSYLILIDLIECDADGTDCFYKEITSGFDSGTIEDTKYIIWEHTDGTATNVQVIVGGYFDGDVS